MTSPLPGLTTHLYPPLTREPGLPLPLFSGNGHERKAQSQSTAEFGGTSALTTTGQRGDKADQGLTTALS